MRRKAQTIPVNHFGDTYDAGIAIGKISVEHAPDLNGIEQSHRHDRHLFFLLESGTVSMEIDFQHFLIESPTITYMHPNQVHRLTAFANVTVSTCAISIENITPENLKLLEDITPARPLLLNQETFTLFSETIALCIKFSERRGDKLYHAMLKDCCNAFVALVASQYLGQARSTDKFSRMEIVTKGFREILERNYAHAKRPADYARELNITVPYLNECVRSATGHAVSHHIQQRIILEAKRLLYHSDKSVKEIASALGFDDYHYFSRLFTKVAGMPPQTFRSKNLN